MRFPEFTDEWSSASFTDVFDMLTNNTFSRAELNYESGTYKNIHYGDILIKYNTYIDVTDKAVPYVNESININKQFTLLTNGDVVFADTAEDYTVGKATEIEHADKVKTLSGLHTIPCRPKFAFVQRYLGYFVNSPSYHNQLLPFIQGIKVSSVSKSQIVKTKVHYPSLQEQAKISCMLSLIDERIDAQNKIIRQYETLIKGIEDYLIGKNVSSILPLNDVAIIEKGQQINGLQLCEIGKYYYLNGGVTPSGYTNDYNTEENTISISEGGNSCGFVKYNTEKFWSGGHCYTLHVREDKCNKKYLYYYLKARENDIMHLRVGSGLPNIQKSSLAKFLVKVPTIEIQIYVVRILDAIIYKNEIEINYLSQLQSQKKYLLSNLFI